MHEEVDGEVIAIDLSGGSYYSLSGSGPAIWASLAAGATESEVCSSLGARFGVEPEAIRPQVGAFIAQLVESGLVGPADGEAPPPQEPAAGDGGSYEPPVLERYTDMKDYFLLDPIHEVDAAGWPKPAA